MIQEATSREIHVGDQDPMLVRKMLEFLYTGDYVYEPYAPTPSAADVVNAGMGSVGLETETASAVQNEAGSAQDTTMTSDRDISDETEEMEAASTIHDEDAGPACFHASMYALGNSSITASRPSGNAQPSISRQHSWTSQRGDHMRRPLRKSINQRLPPTAVYERSS